MAAKGRVKKWNADKGFGFIEPMEGGPDRFFHVSALRDRTLLPQINQLVTYEPGTDKDNRPRAEGVMLVGKSVKRQPANAGGGVELLAVLALFITLIVVAMIGYLPWQVPVLVAGLSGITYVVYAWDKGAAQKNQYRTAEKTLHLLALAGGWPGALVAQQQLRHKSSKAAFRSVFWVTVIFNLSLLGFLMSPVGRLIWQNVL